MDDQRHGSFPRPDLQSPEQLGNGHNGLDLDVDRSEQWMNDYYDRRATRTHGPNGG